jgi:polysaccharide biosynthesis/export protein
VAGDPFRDHQHFAQRTFVRVGGGVVDRLSFSSRTVDMEMRQCVLLIVLSPLLAITGCAIEPGMHWGHRASGTSATAAQPASGGVAPVPAGNAGFAPPGTPAAAITRPDTGPASIPGERSVPEPVSTPGLAPPSNANALPAVQSAEITPDLLRAQSAMRPRSVPSDITALFEKPAPYKIGPGDVLNIMVWDHPELSLPQGGLPTVGIDYTGSVSVASGYSVDSGGMIQFAYAGAVKVAGLTEMEARDLLIKRVGKFIREPQITLRVQTYRSRRVYMDGEVRNPGTLIINDVPMTLPEALNRAGGFTPLGDRAAVGVIRNGREVIVNVPDLVARGINPSDILLKNGDIVRVYAREDSKVFVLGDVSSPKTLYLRNGELSLNEALGDAGGVNPSTGAARQVYVVRNDGPDNVQVFHLDARDPTALALADNFELKAKDVVFVDAAPVVRWNRVVSMLVPAAQAAYFSKTASTN